LIFFNAIEFIDVFQTSSLAPSAVTQSDSVVSQPGTAPSSRLHPAYSRLRRLSQQRQSNAGLIKIAKKEAIREYKAAQAKVAAAHSALMRCVMNEFCNTNLCFWHDMYGYFEFGWQWCCAF